LKTAFVEAEKQLVAVQEIDSTCSGTTAVAVILKGNQMWVANAGDSRAVVASAGEDPDGHLMVTELTEVPAYHYLAASVKTAPFAGPEAEFSP
jgi:serine/threonine protein phosphatase PrpC